MLKVVLYRGHSDEPSLHMFRDTGLLSKRVATTFTCHELALCELHEDSGTIKDLSELTHAPLLQCPSAPGA